MATFPRGIDPELLVSQVKNTMPYLFAGEEGERLARDFPAARGLREIGFPLAEPLTHFEYYRLCLFAHYLTVGTPVPTDVDNQIRQKLWPAGLPVEIALDMAGLILASRAWDFRLVSTRFTAGTGEWSEQTVSGHLGEWFTVASAAYCALGRYPDAPALEMREQLLAAIADEVRRHSEIFGSLWRAGEGLRALTASASLAHNFGDLDRVMDMWELPVHDPLRLHYYKLGVLPFDPNGKLRHKGRLWVAGELYKSPIGGSAMALENHRHFALRKPRALRLSPAMLIPIGPFFDDWGTQVARALADAGGRPTADTLEVVEALKHGWDRLPKTVGYGRALLGMREVHPGLPLEGMEKIRVSGEVFRTSRAAFERTWRDKAIRLMDEIPSRA